MSLFSSCEIIYSITYSVQTTIIFLVSNFLPIPGFQPICTKFKIAYSILIRFRISKKNKKNYSRPSSISPWWESENIWYNFERGSKIESSIGWIEKLYSENEVLYWFSWDSYFLAAILNLQFQISEIGLQKIRNQQQ